VATNDLTVGTVSSNNTIFMTGLTERMRIDSSGNVGIGTTSPLARLDVRSASAAITSGSGNISVFSTDSQGINLGGTLVLGGNADTQISFGSIAGRKENSTTNNRDGYLQFSTYQNGVGNVERMRITSAGNVGIGVTSPAQTLDVSGSMRLTFASGNNRVEFQSSANYIGRNGTTADLDIAVTGAQNINFIISSTTWARLNANGEFITGGTTDQGAYNLQCNGTGVWGAGAYVNGSDERIKMILHHLIQD